MVLRVLRRKFLHALLQNRDRLQPNYFQPSRTILSARKYEPHRQRRLRSATLYPTELRARCYGINDLRVFRPSGFAYASMIGKLRKFHALSSFGRREAFVLSNNPLILYTTNVEIVPAEKGVGYLHCGSASTGGDPMISAWSRSRELRRRSWERASAFWASSAWPSFR